VTTYAAAITHVYDLLIGDLTLAGLIAAVWLGARHRSGPS
jgi:hypothetical protein